MRIFLAVVLVAMVMVSGCITQPGVKDLEGVEVNDYEGEMLTLTVTIVEYRGEA